MIRNACEFTDHRSPVTDDLPFMQELSTQLLADLVAKRRKCLVQLRDLGLRQAQMIAGGEMAEVVSNMEHLDAADLAAIAAYVKALPPVVQESN